jgi:hypothetical protein
LKLNTPNQADAAHAAHANIWLNREEPRRFLLPLCTFPRQLFSRSCRNKDFLLSPVGRVRALGSDGGFEPLTTCSTSRTVWTAIPPFHDKVPDLQLVVPDPSPTRPSEAYPVQLRAGLSKMQLFCPMLVRHIQLGVINRGKVRWGTERSDMATAITVARSIKNWQLEKPRMCVVLHLGQYRHAPFRQAEGPFKRGASKGTPLGADSPFG